MNWSLLSPKQAWLIGGLASSVFGLAIGFTSLTKLTGQEVQPPTGGTTDSTASSSSTTTPPEATNRERAARAARRSAAQPSSSAAFPKSAEFPKSAALPKLADNPDLRANPVYRQSPIPPAAPPVSMPSGVTLPAQDPFGGLPAQAPFAPSPAEAPFGRYYTPVPGLASNQFSSQGAMAGLPSFQPGSAGWHSDPKDAELTQETHQLVNEYRTKMNSKEPVKEVLSDLQSVLDEQFEYRMKLRESELTELKKQVEGLEKALEIRKQKKKEIIERRLLEITDSHDPLQWDAVSPSFGRNGFPGQASWNIQPARNSNGQNWLLENRPPVPPDTFFSNREPGPELAPALSNLPANPTPNSQNVKKPEEPETSSDNPF